MARTKQYATAAERQAAYRERKRNKDNRSSRRTLDWRETDLSEEQYLLAVHMGWKWHWAEWTSTWRDMQKVQAWKHCFSPARDESAKQSYSLWQWGKGLKSRPPKRKVVMKSHSDDDELESEPVVPPQPNVTLPGNVTPAVTNVTPATPPAGMIGYKRTISAIQTLLEYERLVKNVIVTRIEPNGDEWNLYLGPMLLGSYTSMKDAMVAEQALGRIERGEI